MQTNLKDCSDRIDTMKRSGQRSNHRDGSHGQKSRKPNSTSSSEAAEQQPDNSRTNSNISNKNEKFTFFFGPANPFSQWHPAKFKGVPLFKDDHAEAEKFASEQIFSNCEQWMMLNKALLFKDYESAKTISLTTDPKTCKQLGRRVCNFDPSIWSQHNVNIIYEGNKFKFSQNEDLMRKLEQTEGTTLVEASPFDRLYGIGLGEKNPKAANRSTWRGKNLLGETLTKLRDDLIRENA